MKKAMVAALGLAALGLVGCDSPLLHQDRPGGSDYQPGSGSSYSRDYDRGRDYGRDDRGRSDQLRDRDSRWQDPGARSDDDLYRSRRTY